TIGNHGTARVRGPSNRREHSIKLEALLDARSFRTEEGNRGLVIRFMLHRGQPSGTGLARDDGEDHQDEQESRVSGHTMILERVRQPIASWRGWSRDARVSRDIVQGWRREGPV